MSVPTPPTDIAYFKKRVGEWREMPILGHGLYARYQDAQLLLDDALSLAAECERLREALRQIMRNERRFGPVYDDGPCATIARAALALPDEERP